MVARRIRLLSPHLRYRAYRDELRASHSASRPRDHADPGVPPDRRAALRVACRSLRTAHAADDRYRALLAVRAAHGILAELHRLSGVARVVRHCDGRRVGTWRGK